MIDNLFHKYVDKIAKKVIGLSVYVQSDGEYKFFVVLLEKSKNGDLVVNEFNEYDSIDELTGWYQEDHSQYPVLWGIEGKSVLIKVNELKEGLDKSGLMSELIPNANETDFQLNYQFIDEGYFSSLVRKDTFNQIVELLQINGIQLYRSFVGPVSYFHLRNHIVDNSSDLYQFGQYQVDESGELISVIKSGENLKVTFNNNYSLTHDYLNAFGYAMMFYVADSPDCFTEESDESGLIINDFIHRSVFRKLSWSIGIILLVVFFANTIYFISLNDENNTLKETSSNVQQLVNSYDRSKKEFDEKNEIVEKLNYSNIGMAWISDQLGPAIPENVTLTILQIDPISNDKRKKGDPFENEILLIKGESKDNESFGGLIDNLQNLEFIREILFQSYKFNKTKKKGEFEIQLKYKTES